MAILAYDDVMLREPRLLVPRKTPLGPVKIDWRNPITRDLRFCILCGQLVDIVSGNVPFSIEGAPSNGEPGRGWLFAQNQNVQFPTRTSYNILGNLSLFSMFVSNRSTGDWYDPLLIKSNSGLNMPYEWRGSLNSSNARKCLLARANATDYKYRNFSVAWDVNALTTASVSTSDISLSDMVGFLNGKAVALDAGVGTATGNATANNDQLILSERADGATDFVGVHYLHLGWSRLLSAAEHIALHLDPYQVVIPA